MYFLVKWWFIFFEIVIFLDISWHFYLSRKYKKNNIPEELLQLSIET